MISVMVLHCPWRIHLSANTTLLNTPLNGLHLELGARMVPFAGYSMPVQYPMGLMAEHIHTRSEAGLFDVSHMGQLRLVGTDAASVFESLMPVDVIDLPVGKQRYGLLLTDEGNIIDDLMFVNRGADIFVIVNGACKVNDIYAAADLVVARAGASTVAEIATVGIASVLIPWKDAAENHQLTNAKSLSDPGGAVLLEESKLTDDVFVQLIGDLLGDEAMRLRIANEARKLGEVHRNCSIAAVVEKAAEMVVR